MEIRNLENTDFDTLFQGFERAFSDYDIHFEKSEVRAMLNRRGYTPRLSFAAFDEEDEIVAFTLNGVGTFNGISTAYDTGTGTVMEYRGKGLAKEIFNYSMPYLKSAGIEQYLLEVLQNNEKAISVYRKLGFEITREFDCFRQCREVVASPVGDSQLLQIKICPISIGQILELNGFWDFSPYWQNSMDSIIRGSVGLECLGAILDGKIVGYCVFDPLTGDLSQIAVDRDFRRQKIGTRLLREMITHTQSDIIKVLNIPPHCSSLAAFLNKNNIPLSGKQFEMILSFK